MDKVVKGQVVLRVSRFPPASCDSTNVLFFRLSSEVGTMSQLAAEVPRDSVSSNRKKILSIRPFSHEMHAERMKSACFSV